MLSTFFFYGGLGVCALRLAVAAIFIVHGAQKIRNLRRTAEGFNGMGFRPGVFWGTLVTFLEFFGGILLALGLLTQTIAVFFVLEFAVIVIWKIARRQPFTGAGGWELDLLILAAVLVLLWNGGGSYSLDRMFFIGW